MKADARRTAVVDATGQPFLVYHGGTFDPESTELRVWNDSSTARNIPHDIMWFTSSIKDAQYYAKQQREYGAVLTAAYLLIHRPYVLKNGEEANTVLQKRHELEKLGYDGIHDPEVGDWITFRGKEHITQDNPEARDVSLTIVSPARLIGDPALSITATICP